MQPDGIGARLQFLTRLKVKYMSNITISKEYLQGLRKEYNKAVSNKADQFKYKGNDFVTGYAKYFLQYYEPKFNLNNPINN